MKLIAIAKLKRFDGRLLNAGDEFEASDRVAKFLIATRRATIPQVALAKRVATTSYTFNPKTTY